MPALCHTGQDQDKQNDLRSSLDLRSWVPIRNFSLYPGMHPGVNSVNICYLLCAGLPPNLYYFQYSETIVEKIPESKNGFPSNPVTTEVRMSRTEVTPRITSLTISRWTVFATWGRDVLVPL